MDFRGIFGLFAFVTWIFVSSAFGPPPTNPNPCCDGTGPKSPIAPLLPVGQGAPVLDAPSDFDFGGPPLPPPHFLKMKPPPLPNFVGTDFSARSPPSGSGVAIDFGPLTRNDGPSRSSGSKGMRPWPSRSTRYNVMDGQKSIKLGGSNKMSRILLGGVSGGGVIRGRRFPSRGDGGRGVGGSKRVQMPNRKKVDDREKPSDMGSTSTGLTGKARSGFSSLTFAGTNSSSDGLSLTSNTGTGGLSATQKDSNVGGKATSFGSSGVLDAASDGIGSSGSNFDMAAANPEINGKGLDKARSSKPVANTKPKSGNPPQMNMAYPKGGIGSPESDFKFAVGGIGIDGISASGSSNINAVEAGFEMRDSGIPAAPIAVQVDTNLVKARGDVDVKRPEIELSKNRPEIEISVQRQEKERPQLQEKELLKRKPEIEPFQTPDLEVSQGSVIKTPIAEITIGGPEGTNDISGGQQVAYSVPLEPNTPDVSSFSASMQQKTPDLSSFNAPLKPKAPEASALNEAVQQNMPEISIDIDKSGQNVNVEVQKESEINLNINQGPPCVCPTVSSSSSPEVIKADVNVATIADKNLLIAKVPTAKVVGNAFSQNLEIPNLVIEPLTINNLSPTQSSGGFGMSEISLDSSGSNSDVLVVAALPGQVGSSSKVNVKVGVDPKSGNLVIETTPSPAPIVNTGQGTKRLDDMNAIDTGLGDVIDSVSSGDSGLIGMLPSAVVSTKPVLTDVKSSDVQSAVGSLSVGCQNGPDCSIPGMDKPSLSGSVIATQGHDDKNGLLSIEPALGVSSAAANVTDNSVTSADLVPVPSQMGGITAIKISDSTNTKEEDTDDSRRKSLVTSGGGLSSAVRSNGTGTSLDNSSSAIASANSASVGNVDISGNNAGNISRESTGIAAVESGSAPFSGFEAFIAKMTKTKYNILVNDERTKVDAGGGMRSKEIGTLMDVNSGSSGADGRPFSAGGTIAEQALGVSSVNVGLAGNAGNSVDILVPATSPVGGIRVKQTVNGAKTKEEDTDDSKKKLLVTDKGGVGSVVTSVGTGTPLANSSAFASAKLAGVNVSGITSGNVSREGPGIVDGGSSSALFSGFDALIAKMSKSKDTMSVHDERTKIDASGGIPSKETGTFMDVNSGNSGSDGGLLSGGTKAEPALDVSSFTAGFAANAGNSADILVPVPSKVGEIKFTDTVKSTKRKEEDTDDSRKKLLVTDKNRLNSKVASVGTSPSLDNSSSAIPSTKTATVGSVDVSRITTGDISRERNGIVAGGIGSAPFSGFEAFIAKMTKSKDTMSRNDEGTKIDASKRLLSKETGTVMDVNSGSSGVDGGLLGGLLSGRPKAEPALGVSSPVTGFAGKAGNSVDVIASVPIPVGGIKVKQTVDGTKTKEEDTDDSRKKLLMQDTSGTPAVGGGLAVPFEVINASVSGNRRSSTSKAMTSLSKIGSAVVSSSDVSTPLDGALLGSSIIGPSAKDTATRLVSPDTSSIKDSATGPMSPDISLSKDMNIGPLSPKILGTNISTAGSSLPKGLELSVVDAGAASDTRSIASSSAGAASLAKAGGLPTSLGMRVSPKAANVSVALTSPKPKIKKLNLAALCLLYLGAFIDGVGYAPYPGNCQKLVQCFYNRGKLRAVARECPLGMFWDQSLLLCRIPGDVPCFDDRCLVHGTLRYGRSGGCGCYFKCIEGISVPASCPIGYKYDDDDECKKVSGIGDDVCDDDCDTPGDLDKLTSANCPSMPDPENKFGYIDREFGGLRFRGCPDGTMYSTRLCRCQGNLNKHLNGQFRRQCVPEFKMNFDDGFRDLSDGGLSFEYKNIFRSNKACKFDGDGQIFLWGFTSRYLGQKFAIKLKVKPFRGSGMRRPQVIVSNCGPHGEPSIEISIYKGRMRFKAKTTGSNTVVTGSELYNEDEWNEVTYYYNGKHFGGSCGRNSFKRVTGGNLEPRDNPLSIGSCGSSGFRGEMDDLEIFTACVPRDV